jgi:tricorn protease
MHVAWTSTRDGSRSFRRGPQEAYAVSVDGGPVRRLTYWGDRFATVRGWVSDDEVLVLSRTGQHASRKGSTTGRRATSRSATVPYVGRAMNVEPAEPAQWNGYRGGAVARSGTRRTARTTRGSSPTWVTTWSTPCSSNFGSYSCRTTRGSARSTPRSRTARTCAATDLGEHYARRATTDGQRVVYQRAGEIWMLESPDAEPMRLDIRLGGDGSGRTP